MDVPLGLVHQMESLEDAVYEFSTHHFGSDSHRLVRGGPKRDDVICKVRFGRDILDRSLRSSERSTVLVGDVRWAEGDDLLRGVTDG